MQVVNPLSISYTKNQSDERFINVSLDSTSIGTPNPVNADTLSGKTIDDFVLKSENVSSSSFYLLWTNSNYPSEGTINISLNDYDAILMYFGITSDLNYGLVSGIFLKNQYCIIEGTKCDYQDSSSGSYLPPPFISEIMPMAGTPDGVQWTNYYRYLYITNNNIQMSDCLNNESSTTAKQQALYPYKIYGIKF